MYLLHQTILPGLYTKYVPSSSDYFYQVCIKNKLYYRYLELLYFYSFPTDFQMVMDAAIVVTYHPDGKAADLQKEALYPPRHKMTLPLNCLNNYFQNCEIAFNHHTKLDCDRNYFLDFDGWGLMSALDQNFNPSISDIQRRSKQGRKFKLKFLFFQIE
jgi:hypothetical protein